MNIDWKRKLTSRKLWVAVAGFVAGLIMAFGGSEGTAETVSGCILSGAAVVGYVIGEGLADSAGANTTFATVSPEGGTDAAQLRETCASNGGDSDDNNE